jgi:signal transduction histidine kinase
VDVDVRKRLLRQPGRRAKPFDAGPEQQTDRFARVERTIAIVRLIVVAGLGAFVASGTAGDDDLRSWAIGCVVVAAIYAAAMVWPAARLGTAVSTGLDLGLTLTLIAITGAGRSLAIGVLLLVVVATALRFAPRTSWIVAALASAVLAAVVIVVEEPSIDTGTRVQIAAGWATIIVLGAVLIGLLAQLEVDDRTELALANERAVALEATDRQRRLMLRTIAHDLTPGLESIRAISRTLADPATSLSADEQSEALALVRDHAEYLLRFAGSLREVASSNDLTRIDRAQLRQTEIAALIESVTRVEAFGTAAITLQIEAELPIIATDPDKLRRVLINLVENSKRYATGTGGILVRATSDGPWVCIDITDDGPGVDPQHLHGIFDPDRSFGDRSGEGGLGLWIVAELVRQLGGHIDTRNSDGGGLTVSLRLPVGTRHTP